MHSHPDLDVMVSSEITGLTVLNSSSYFRTLRQNISLDSCSHQVSSKSFSRPSNSSNNLHQTREKTRIRGENFSHCCVLYDRGIDPFFGLGGAKVRKISTFLARFAHKVAVPNFSRGACRKNENKLCMFSSVFM